MVFRAHVGPDRVERLEPRKEGAVRLDHPRQHLVEVVVGIDHPGHDDVTVLEVENLVGGAWKLCRGTHLLDGVAADENRAAGDLATPLVHGDQRMDVLDQ